MKNKKKLAVASCAMALAMSAGAFAGCAALETKDSAKDIAQTIAEVNLTESSQFREEFAGLEDAITTTVVTKRDMIESFIGSGYSVMNTYGWTYSDTFNAICESLVDNQIYIQYAKAYFLKNGWTDTEDDTQYAYTLSGYQAAVDAAEGETAKAIAGITYFLTQKEIETADYSVRVYMNNSIDSLEKAIIIAATDDTEYETSVRTTPTGVDTEDSDYYDVAYRVYTGTGEQAGVQGSYEKVDGSSPTTRMTAYGKFLSNLKTNGLLVKGEDTSDIESLQYYQNQKKSAYENLLITKLGEVFTDEAIETLTQEYCEESYATTLATQRSTYLKDVSTLESDLGSVSDTKFVMTSPGEEDKYYGLVINILLPFSASQSQALADSDKDYGDTKGNKFVTRANLLKQIKATDQRGSWFTGETDYSFAATDAVSAYDGGDANRTWLFFENSLFDETGKYELLSNYYGKYTYNGTYDADKRVYVPNKLTVDGFLGEMESYLGFAFGKENVLTGKEDYSAGYYAQTVSDYYTDGKVDYSKFVYTSGKIDWSAVAGEGETATFNANNIFLAGSKENIALSVINELSFAYNTDTAGLNTYLGYAVTANKTDFVSEFEYAAQQAVRGGAGTYYVVPSDYGWHIIYCTFSLADTENGQPYTFNWDDVKTEGTFSYLYYEALKADAYSTTSTNIRSQIINSYSGSSTVYEDRYSDLTGLDSST